MNRIVTIILALTLSGSGLAAERPTKPTPETAASPEAIRKAIDAFKGFGCVQSFHFDRWGQEVIVLWYCPFSGRAACFLHGYYYDPKEKKWVRFLNDFVEGTHDLSASMPCGQESVLILDARGKEVRKVDVSKFPRRKWEEERGTAEQPAGGDAEDRAPQP